MSAKYLIRLEDASDVMDRRKWGLIEQLLDRHGIKPIVAVVPDNRDTDLAFDSPDDAFWDKVRQWQAKGWAVAMHGHTHVMHPTEGKLLVPYYKRSEFAGLDYAAQSAKIRMAWGRFVAQRVTPVAWVGPAHSFDRLTLEAIRNETSIRVLSDAIAWNTYYEHGFHWIPQQLWRLTAREFGLWTVCLHPNQMRESDITAFDEAVGNGFRGKIIAFNDVRLRKRGRSIPGWLYHEYFWWRWRRDSRSLQR